MRGREEPIRLTGQYCFEWRDYAKPQASSRGVFRYLAVEVGVGSSAVQQRVADEGRADEPPALRR